MSNFSQSECVTFPDPFIIAALWAAVRNAVVLPLSVFILCCAFVRWRPLRSFHSTSHCDFLTFHMAALELVSSLGSVLYLCPTNGAVSLSGKSLMVFSFTAQNLVHCLTCVDRFLAVVHPVAYLKSKREARLWVRDAGVSAVWGLSLGSMLILPLSLNRFPVVPYVCFVLSSLAVVSFCSVSVLRALLRPQPGDAGRVDRSKCRAFKTITAILATISFSFITFVLSVTLSIGQTVRVYCLLFTVGLFSNIPSSLVLPLLFLNRSHRR